MWSPELGALLEAREAEVAQGDDEVVRGLILGLAHVVKPLRKRRAGRLGLAIEGTPAVTERQPTRT